MKIKSKKELKDILNQYNELINSGYWNRTDVISIIWDSHLTKEELLTKSQLNEGEGK